MRRLCLGATALLALFAAQPAAASQCQPADLAALSGWNGVWIAEGLLADVNGREAPGAPPFVMGMKLLGLEAPWTTEGWLKFGEGMRIGLRGGALQQGWGFPLMMSAPAPFTVVVAPSQTVIVSQYREVRYIVTDGSGHAPEDERYPTLWGDSTGCWQGDTLTVETVGVRYDAEFNYAAPTLSDEAVFVEKIRLTAPGRLESDITITDPATLEHPWVTHMVYMRHPVLTRLVHEGDNLAGNRIVIGEQNTIGAAPSAPKAPPLPPEIALEPQVLDRFVGQYQFDGAPLRLVVERRGGRLFMSVPPVLNSFVPMIAVAEGKFMSVDGGEFAFATGPAGGVTGFTGTDPTGAEVAGKRLP